MQPSTNSNYRFGQALINELIEFTTSHFAGLPCSVVFVVLVFMLDTTLRSSSAKLFFVCGYLIEFLLFYSISAICFPRAGGDDGEGKGRRNGRSSTASSFAQDMRGLDDDELMYGGGAPQGNLPLLSKVRFLAQPFQLLTEASFFNFSAGYVLGYWGNLNILTETKNATVTTLYYFAFVIFCYLYSVFYLQNATSWQSGLISTVVGVIGGMICSSLVADRVKLEAAYDHQFMLGARDGGVGSGRSGSGTPSDVTACDANNEDMVCQVFRAGS